MAKLGITKEQDEEWHRTHLTLDEEKTQATKGIKGINPFAAGGGFLAWCVTQGWLMQRGKQLGMDEQFAGKVQRPASGGGVRRKGSARCSPGAARR